VNRLAISWLLAVVFVSLGSASGADRGFDWVKVTDRAGWEPRDSQGELVYDNKMWILGGWFERK
jgi:hypothetical protein